MLAKKKGGWRKQLESKKRVGKIGKRVFIMETCAGKVGAQSTQVIRKGHPTCDRVFCVCLTFQYYIFIFVQCFHLRWLERRRHIAHLWRIRIWLNYSENMEMPNRSCRSLNVRFSRADVSIMCAVCLVNYTFRDPTSMFYGFVQMQQLNHLKVERGRLADQIFCLVRCGVRFRPSQYTFVEFEFNGKRV